MRLTSWDEDDDNPTETHPMKTDAFHNPLHSCTQVH